MDDRFQSRVRLRFPGHLHCLSLLEASAQILRITTAETTTLVGIVTDSAHAPIQSAEVRLSDINRSVLSDSVGPLSSLPQSLAQFDSGTDPGASTTATPRAANRNAPSRCAAEQDQAAPDHDDAE